MQQQDTCTYLVTNESMQNILSEPRQTLEKSFYEHPMRSRSASILDTTPNWFLRQQKSFQSMKILEETGFDIDHVTNGVSDSKETHAGSC